MRGTHDLEKEHRVIETMVAVMQRAAASENWSDVAACHDFFQGFVDACHHAKEEKYLLPAMERKGLSRENSPIGAILEDHTWGRELLGNIEEGLQKVHRGEDCGRETLSYHILVYSAMLSAHIGKENNVLFIIAGQVLNEDERTALDEAYEYFENNVLGPEYHHRYHSLAADLAGRYGLSL
jgi:hemerythrin-like domain-containing protein